MEAMMSKIKNPATLRQKARKKQLHHYYRKGLAVGMICCHRRSSCSSGKFVSCSLVELSSHATEGSGTGQRSGSNPSSCGVAV
jgi:hypothetical protein